MKTITRKTMLYKTGVEYGDYTMNHVLGCAHGCLFPCYAYMMAKRFGKVKSYDEWTEPSLVSNTLELLDKEIPRLKEKINNVQLCFTTDPFMFGYDEVGNMSIAAIKKLNSYGIPCTILSKGILPAELSNYSKLNSYGITLVSLDEDFRFKYEPGSASYKERVEALRALHNSGCKTWVSIEPYPTPNLIQQNLVEVLNAISFVDKVIFGRTNYSKVVSSFPECKTYYREQAMAVIQYCKDREIDYYIKKGTL